MIDRDTSAILRRLTEQWRELLGELQRLNQVAEVRPADDDVFQPLNEGGAEAAFFELKPVVFNLPERATHANNDLYVVVQGRLAFQRQEFTEHRRLLTHSFSTQTAYFRRKTDSLDHIFGAHYDFAKDELGHPAFHVQMKSFAEMAAHVRERYRLDLQVKDVVKGVLKTVRIPTAQMDVFSLFVQICADHLLHSESSTDQVRAFDTLLSKSKFCQGAGFQVPRMGTAEAIECYRARHWYPTTAV